MASCAVLSWKQRDFTSAKKGLCGVLMTYCCVYESVCCSNVGRREDYVISYVYV
jgi:hypothetical protein